jgi:hypothetical protein
MMQLGAGGISCLQEAAQGPLGCWSPLPKGYWMSWLAGLDGLNTVLCKCSAKCSARKGNRYVRVLTYPLPDCCSAQLHISWG